MAYKENTLWPFSTSEWAIGTPVSLNSPHGWAKAGDGIEIPNGIIGIIRALTSEDRLRVEFLNVDINALSRSIKKGLGHPHDASLAPSLLSLTLDLKADWIRPARQTDLNLASSPEVA